MTHARLFGTGSTVFRAFFGSILTVGLLVGCGGGDSDEAIVASVGEREVTMREVTDYITSLSVDYRTSAEEYRARRRRLKRLIEDELFIIGAYDQALDADIGILEVVEQEKDKFLLDELYRTQVLDAVTVTDREIREAYDVAYQRVRFLHILIESKERGDSAMVRLRAGEDFGSVADDFSLDDASRMRGGDMGREFGWGELPPEIDQALFSIPEGEIVGPIQTDFGWHIVKLTSRKQIEKPEYEKVKVVLETRIRRRKEQKRRIEHIESIKAQFQPEFNAETLRLWQARRQAIADTTPLSVGQSAIVPPDQLTDDEKALPAYRYGTDKEVNLGQFCAMLQTRSPYEQPDPTDSQAMIDLAFNGSMYDLLLSEARRLRLDETDIYRDRVREYQETLMADRMRNQIVIRGLRVTDEEIAAFYETTKDSLVEPAQYHVRELMLRDSTQLATILRQIRGGADFGAMAKKHSERSGVAANGGDLGWLMPYMYPDFYNVAKTLSKGAVSDIIPAVNQYSIIQLLDIRPEEQMSLDDARSVIFERLQNQKREAATVAYLDSLQTMHPVTVHEDVLESGLDDVSHIVDSLGTDWKVY